MRFFFGFPALIEQDGWASFRECYPRFIFMIDE